MSIKESVRLFFGRRLNEVGQEVPDPKPVGLPIGYKHPPTLEQRIKSMIEVTLSRQAAAAGSESFEEANDFDVDDDGPEEVFPDEDFAANDPNVKDAFEREEPVVRERLSKAKQELLDKKAALAAEKKARAKPAAAGDAEGDEPE